MRLKPMKILVAGSRRRSAVGDFDRERGRPVRGVTDTEITIGTITDLSGVTAVQGVNNSDAVRMAFDEANEKGGVNGRKIKYVVEDNQYQVPRAVQAMNKLLNNDNVFMTIDDGGTPMNDANMPTQFAKNVPNMFPLTAARSMYEPYNRLKFGQFASYYDQMRAAVKYFAETKAAKRSASPTRIPTSARMSSPALSLKPRRSGSRSSIRPRTAQPTPISTPNDQTSRCRL